MSSSNTQICPWCQTEIVWDPEIGPEKECPYCYNELGDYRSVNLSMNQPQKEEADMDDEEEDEGDRNVRQPADDFLDDEEYRDIYIENVEKCIDTQVEAPECSNCRELMLFGGTVRLADGHSFTPAEPAILGKPLLPQILSQDLYVCPSCFKTQTYLSEPGRLALTQTLKDE